MTCSTSFHSRTSRVPMTGLRGSTFRDWAAEHTGYGSDIVEMALAHTISSKTEAAYEALKAQLSPKQIVGVLLNPENAVSAHCLDQRDPKRAAIRAVQNARRDPDIQILFENLGARNSRADNDNEAQTVELLTLDQMRERFVFIKDGSQVADLNRPHFMMTLSDFRNATAASTVRVPKNSDGGYRTVPCSEAWLQAVQTSLCCWVVRRCDALTFMRARAAS